MDMKEEYGLTPYETREILFYKTDNGDVRVEILLYQENLWLTQAKMAELFENIKKLADKYISQGVNMGEGWLIPAEMAALAETGTENIICAQPFGCLPNHIVAKGMSRVIKEAYPGANIVAIDYDPGATKVNQENRIKLMLANAKK